MAPPSQQQNPFNLPHAAKCACLCCSIPYPPAILTDWRKPPFFPAFMKFYLAMCVNMLMRCLQAWRIAHPPMRGTNWLGTRPLVHVGFLKSWLAGGLKYKVVSHILEAVQQCKQESESDQPVKIFVTGKHCVCSMAYLGEHRLAVVTT